MNLIFKIKEFELKSSGSCAGPRVNIFKIYEAINGSASTFGFIGGPCDKYYFYKHSGSSDSWRR